MSAVVRRVVSPGIKYEARILLEYIGASMGAFARFNGQLLITHDCEGGVT